MLDLAMLSNLIILFIEATLFNLKGIFMKKMIFPMMVSLFISLSASAAIADNTHANAIRSLSFVENSSAYANQAAINGHIKAGKLTKSQINGVAKPFWQMSQHEQAAVALTFTENSMSYANQVAINGHIKAGKLKASAIQGGPKSFSQMNPHEKAVTALSFTENSSSPSIQRAINHHLLMN